MDKDTNIILSRADWRYLLPIQRPKRSIVFGDGILADAVELISESAVRHGTNYKSEDFDLAVAVNPSNKSFRELWSAVKPGGFIYIEWTVNPFSNLLSIKKKLEAVGFQDIKFYIPKPDPSKAPSEFWIPLVKNVITDYIIRQNHKNKRKHIIKWFSQRLRLFLLSFNPKLFISFPWLISSELKMYKVCSIASKSISGYLSTNTLQNPNIGESRANDSISNIISESLYKLDAHFLPKEISISILTERGGFNGFHEKIILFIYKGMDSKPAFVIKLPRANIPNSSQENGINIIDALRDEFNMIDGIPRVLFNGYKSGTFITAETFIKGIELSQKITESSFPNLAIKITEWLVVLGEKTKTIAPQNLRDDLKERNIANFIKLYGSVLDADEIKQIYSVLNELKPNCRVCVHNDFGPWNILIDSNGIFGVVDWESALLSGFPFTDLITIQIWMNFQVQKTYRSGKYGQSYISMLDTSTFTGRVFKNCLKHYADNLDLSESDIPAFRLFTLIIQAQFEFPHLNSELQESNKDINSLEKGFYLQLVKEELQYSSKSNTIRK